MASVLVCQFCSKGKAIYFCPRCNAPYCELKCYQCESHRQCSESFYKQCIETEIASRPVATSSQLKTLETLKKNYQENLEEDNDELDSDDEEELSDRLKGVDLNDTDQVWSLLTPEERRDFQKKVESGEIYSLVPKDNELISLWWEVFFPKKKIVEVDEKSVQLHSKIPSLFVPESKFETSSCSKSIKYNLINILLVYAFGYKYLLWHDKDTPKKEDLHEFSKLLLTLSKSLVKAEEIPSFDHAIESVLAIALGSNFNKYTNDLKSTKLDVIKILRGPGDGFVTNHYTHAAFSDVRNILQCTLASYRKNSFFTKKELFTSVKKIEFYICWIMNNYEEFDSST